MVLMASAVGKAVPLTKKKLINGQTLLILTALSQDPNFEKIKGFIMLIDTHWNHIMLWTLMDPIGQNSHQPLRANKTH